MYIRINTFVSYISTLYSHEITDNILGYNFINSVLTIDHGSDSNRQYIISSFQSFNIYSHDTNRIFFFFAKLCRKSGNFKSEKL